MQKMERFRLMSKKFAHALLDEEVKDDERLSKKRLQTAKTATNEGAFKSLQAPTKPPRSHHSMTDSHIRMVAMNNSASSGGQPQFAASLQASPGMTSRLDAMSIDTGSGSKKKGKR